MFINPINQGFGSSRIKVDKVYPKTLRKSIKSLPELNVLASKKDVYFKFIPSEKNPSNTVMTIFKRGIDHIADIPEYAMTHNTGDQVYINWERSIYREELPLKKENIIQRAKEFFGFAD